LELARDWFRRLRDARGVERRWLQNYTFKYPYCIMLILFFNMPG
jgi:hypothetical protein